MKAKLLQRDRIGFDDGAILEMVIWEVSKPVEGSHHHFKYRLFYGYPGDRIICYDNEQPKGDHRHLDGLEEVYRFISPEVLVQDFIAAVKSRRKS